MPMRQHRCRNCQQWYWTDRGDQIYCSRLCYYVYMRKDVVIGIVGSRRRTDENKVRETVRELYTKHGAKLIIVSGGCAGVDSWAEDEARKLGIPDDRIKIFYPNLVDVTDYYEKVQAYYKRNWKIANIAVDGIIAFVAENRKGGTENTIKHAKELGRNIEIR